jgi:hypothetical protein
LPRSLGTTPAIIVFPEVKPSAQAIEGADDDHKPGGLLQNEWVLFHEYAHLLAIFRLNILSGNYWINELVAGIFTTSYIAQSRADLAFVLQERRKNSRPARYRYTSLADLNYLGAFGMDPQNYGNWFQFHLERLADFLTRDQPLPAVVAKLQTDFPEDDIKFETPDELIKKLSRIRPGLLDAVAGPLAGPLTLAANTPIACTDASPDRTRTTSVSIHNRRSEPIVVTFSGGTTRTIQPQTNATLYNVYPGAPIKLSDGRCIVPRADPTLTYIDK